MFRWARSTDLRHDSVLSLRRQLCDTPNSVSAAELWRCWWIAAQANLRRNMLLLGSAPQEGGLGRVLAGFLANHWQSPATFSVQASHDGGEIKCTYDQLGTMPNALGGMEVVDLLGHAAAAIRPGGRLILATEYVVGPEKGGRGPDWRAAITASKLMFESCTSCDPVPGDPRFNSVWRRARALLVARDRRWRRLSFGLVLRKPYRTADLCDCKFRLSPSAERASIARLPAARVSRRFDRLLLPAELRRRAGFSLTELAAAFRTETDDATDLLNELACRDLIIPVE